MYTTCEDVRNLCNLISMVEIPDYEVGSFIEKAQVRIDKSLRKRYRVPLSEPVPEIIKSIATDMAASFLLDKYYSDRSPDRTNLADIYAKRAEADLDQIVNEGAIDDIVGVIENEPPAPISRPAIATTTPGESSILDIISKW